MTHGEILRYKLYKKTANKLRLLLALEREHDIFLRRRLVEG